ncbi:MAG: hypothetical protein K2H93_01525 [Oscillospiraceae bacterium]|nr:hypothetical protein [Ruminococcus sp.]MDE5737027.1 hypothetical protein [Oscillospiraceae bacterium]MDE6708257.1 hypothetical protein [Oscillospiraceae bacterium]
MYIFSQNKEAIVNLDSNSAIYISYSEKEKDFRIDTDCVILARYSDKETAKKMLIKIYTGLKNGDKFFEVE